MDSFGTDHIGLGKRPVPLDRQRERKGPGSIHLDETLTAGRDDRWEVVRGSRMPLTDFWNCMDHSSVVALGSFRIGGHAD